MPALVLSVPLEGPTGEAGADAAEAVRLAVEDAASPVRVLVENSGPGPCSSRAVANAEAAAANDEAIAYLGEFHSAATERSLPVLEAGGLPHVSFSNTYRRLAGRSFVNVMPTDELQAAALVQWMAEGGVRRPFLADDGEEYGVDMRLLVKGELPAAPVPEPEAADALFVGAAAGDSTASLLAELHGRAPDAPVFGMEGLLSDDLAAASRRTWRRACA
jgi:ABC-type branched-subunit amino acid transport system substrate-binding protein